MTGAPASNTPPVDKRHTSCYLCPVSEFDWSDEKNEVLERTREVCFEDVVVCIQNGDVLDILRHPHRDRYPGQYMMVLNIEGYVWLVPYVKQRGVRFLKTIIPSRKATREYLT
jgi:hypothetical protein